MAIIPGHVDVTSSSRNARASADGVPWSRSWRHAGDHGYIGVVPAPTSCDICGFRWGDVTGDVGGRLTRASESFVDVVTNAGALVSRRPSPERWSILEYAGHVRDVLISIRERIVLAVVTDRPTGVAMHRDERVDRGLYQCDTVADVSAELAVVTRLFTKTVSSLREEDARRALIYSSASPHEVTVAWAIAQAIHEVEHHLSDIRENLTRLD